MMQDFRKLDAELKAEGVFDPSLSHFIYRTAEIIGMVVLGIYMMYL